MSLGSPGEPSEARANPLVRWTRPLAIAGGLLLLAVAGVVVTSVLLRWLTQSSISGDFELVQVATALAAFAFLPYCQAERGNIMVDTFTHRLPARMLRKIDATWDIVYAVVAAIIGWRLAVGALDAMRSRMLTMVLNLPQGWAIAACSVMIGLLVIVALAGAWRVLQDER